MNSFIVLPYKETRQANAPRNKNGPWKDSSKEDSTIISKYRDIPVGITNGSLKASGVSCENVYAVKEVHRDDRFKSTVHCSESNQAYDSAFTGSLKKSSMLDTGVSVNSIQRALHQDQTLLDRGGQGSISEPSLLTKDRGDNFIQGICGEDTYMANKHGDDTTHNIFMLGSKHGDGNHKLSTKGEQGVKGSIYIKNDGKTYKSSIEAKLVSFEESDHIKCKGQYPETKQLVMSVPAMKKQDDYSSFGKNSFKDATEDKGDFEIAIYLTGFGNISEKISQKQNVNIKKGVRKPRMVKEFNKKMMKSHRSTPTMGKMRETGREIYALPKFLTIEKPGREIYRGAKAAGQESDSSYRYERNLYQSNKLNAEFVFSSDESDKDYSFHKSTNRRSRVLSHSSINSRSSGASLLPKPKVSDGELWSRFEIIFRK